MSNNINRIRKKKLKGTGIFAAAALTAALIAGNNIPGVTRQVSAAESQENTVSSLIPDNITLDKPVELADVELPTTEYGTFEWADGSFVPAQRVQSCEVLLIPAEGQDLSHVDGWDPESGAQILAADRFIADFSVPASSPAAFIAEKFHLVLLRLRQCI